MSNYYVVCSLNPTIYFCRKTSCFGVIDPCFMQQADVCILLLGKTNDVVYCIQFESLIYIANRREFTFFIYYTQGDLLLKCNQYFEYQGENGIQGCLLLNLLLQSNFTIEKDLFVTLDLEATPEHRSGWKELTQHILFSNLTAYQRKGSPSTRKRDKPAASAGVGIAEKLARKKEEILQKRVTKV